MSNLIEQCDREIAEAEAALRQGLPNEALLVLWLSDWSAEKRLLESEGATQC